MFRTKRVAIAGMLSAMCAILGYISVDFANLRFTFVSFPVYIGAFLLGGPAGFFIGFIGNFIYQVLKFGITATTLLWIIPYAAAGYAAGAYAASRHFNMNTRQTLFILAVCGFMISTLNTIAFYIDARIYGYYNPVTMLGAIPPRYIKMVIEVVIYYAAVPAVLRAVKRALRTELKEGA